MGNRYRDFDKHDVGRMLHKLRHSPSESDVEAIRERLADYDPVELLTIGADWAAFKYGKGAAGARTEVKARRYRAMVTRWQLGITKGIGVTNAQSAWLDRKGDKLPVVRCANCKKNFYAARADAVTCSARCRTALHRKRGRALNHV
jgi:hypothetical protein